MAGAASPPSRRGAFAAALFLLLAVELCDPAAAAALAKIGGRPSSRKSRRAHLTREMELPTAPADPNPPDPMDDPSTDMALAVVRAGDVRKARDITALRVGHLTSAASYFVNMVGGSKVQINAIVKNIEDELGEQFERTGRRQGKAQGGWVCIDYDDVVVNVFSEQQRDFYGIEKFWAAAQPLDLSDVVTPDSATSPGWEAAGPEEDADDDDWTLDDDDDWTLDDVDLAPATPAARDAGLASVEESENLTLDDDEDWTLDDAPPAPVAARVVEPLDEAPQAEEAAAPAAGGWRAMMEADGIEFDESGEAAVEWDDDDEAGVDDLP